LIRRKGPRSCERSVTLDDQPPERAADLAGVREREVLLREALRALIERESACRLGGSAEPSSTSCRLRGGGSRGDPQD
jgi:hypothetical protein